jgi:catechol 2,3-dioxygenase-like lactoylglutathione lyase family enzyme
VEGPAFPQIAQIVLDTTNPRASAEFWRQFLDLVYREGHEPPAPGAEDPAGSDWLNLLSRDGARCLAFQRVGALARSTWPEATIPQQLHLDLTVGTLDELNGAHARVLELGGELRYDRSDSPEEPLLVFSDPDGHPFCVFVERRGEVGGVPQFR